MREGRSPFSSGPEVSSSTLQVPATKAICGKFSLGPRDRIMRRLELGFGDFSWIAGEGFARSSDSSQRTGNHAQNIRPEREIGLIKAFRRG